MGSPVTVLGSGSWGTALAIHLARGGHDVTLWARNAEEADPLRADREHKRLHPGVAFPNGLQVTTDLGAACARPEALVFVCPSHAIRELSERVRPVLRTRPVIVSAAKGVEESTSKTTCEVLVEVLGGDHAPRVAALSGPSFAKEVAKGMPTAVTAAAEDLDVASAVQRLFHGPTFRVYTSTDLVGVEIGGAVKNVIAIAAGVSDGLGFGHSTRAALITRGLAEISRLAVRRGADRQTLYGLSGLGDLVLTATGDLSRNRTVGLRLGRGEKLEDIIASMTEVAEGVRNTRSVHLLATAVGIEMPIAEQMYQVLYEAKDPTRAVVDLMTRRSRHEAE